MVLVFHELAEHKANIESSGNSLPLCSLERYGHKDAIYA
jgi:hypothetical protein